MARDDAALLEQWVHEGDAEAFKEIVSRYAGMVYGTCKRLLGSASEAEDVAQECFEALVRVRSKPAGYLGPWLHKVATNRSLKRAVSERRRRERENRFAQGLESQTEAGWDDVYGYIDEAIAELPDALRVPVVEHFLADQTHEAIAQTLGLTRQGVTYRIGQGIERVRKSLKKRGVPLAAVALAALLKANLTEAAPASLVGALGRLALMGPIGAPASVLSGLNGLWRAVLSAKALALGCILAVVAVGGYLSYMHGSTEGQVCESTSLTIPSDPKSEAPQAPSSGEKPTTALPAKATLARSSVGSMGTLTGVISDMGGAPIAGATVNMAWGEEGKQNQATTDSSGRFSVAYDSASLLNSFSVSAAGFPPLNYRFLPVIRGAELELQVKMIVGKEYRGVLTDREGHPISGARVGTGERSSMSSVLTDAEGAFAVIADLEHPSFWFEHPGFANYKIDMTGAENGARGMKVQAQRPGVLRVKVMRGSNPVPGVPVEALDVQAVSDENGIAELRVPAPGSYAPTARDNEGNVASLATGTTTVEEDEVTECTVTFPSEYPASVRGCALDAEGQPLPLAHVSITNERRPELYRPIAVAADGTFRAGLEMGKNRVSVRVPEKEYLFEEGNWRELAVAGPQQFEVTFRVAREQEVMNYAVSMMDSAGQPVTDVLLRPASEPPSDEVNGVVDVVIHAAEGEFELDGRVPLTIYDEQKENLVCLGEPGEVNRDAEPSCMYEISTGRMGRLVRRDSGVAELLVRFEDQSGSIEGTVVDDSDAPLPAVYVSLEKPTHRRVDVRQTRADGAFRFDFLPPGEPYTISLNCESPMTETGLAYPGKVAASPPTPLKLILLSTAAEVSGIVVDEHNVALGGAVIRYRDAGVRESMVAADEQGRFAVHVPRGEYTFWTINEHREKSEPVHISAPAKGVVLVVPSSPGEEEAATAPDDALHAQRKSSLQQIGLVFKKFANESKGSKYPALSNQYGAFYPDPNPLYPEYISDPATLAALMGKQDVKLCYFGYAITDDASATAFLDAYEEYGPEGLQGEDLTLEGDSSEVGFAGRLLRLRQGIERFLITDVNDANASAKAQSILPIVWELPSESEGAAWVLYMDGHTEWKPYPGEFPMTEALITRVKTIMASARQR